MNTTVLTGAGRVHNIGLMGLQQNFLMFGGLLFLAGIVLFSVVKMKQTPEDETKQRAELAAKQKAMQDVAGRAASTVATAASTVATESSGLWKSIAEHFSRPEDSRTGRMFTGLFVGVCLALPVTAFLSFGSVLVVFATLWFAFRLVPAVQAMRPLLAVNAIAFAIMGMLAFIPLPGSIMANSFFLVAIVSAFSY